MSGSRPDGRAVDRRRLDETNEFAQRPRRAAISRAVADGEFSTIETT